MGKNKGRLIVTQEVDAPAKAIYFAFTNQAAVRGWLCDNVQVAARENGRLYLHWNRGYYACGEFTALEPDTSLAFTWPNTPTPSNISTSPISNSIGWKSRRPVTSPASAGWAGSLAIATGPCHWTPLELPVCKR